MLRVVGTTVFAVSVLALIVLVLRNALGPRSEELPLPITLALGGLAVAGAVAAYLGEVWKRKRP